MSVTRAAACLLAALMVGGLAAEQTPEVRHWLSARDALPTAAATADWSFAGYGGGDTALPSPAVKYDVVRDFQAVGDGQADDTNAFQSAVAAANKQPGVIQLPAGTYRLSRPLTITSAGVVLRGEGEDKTRILIEQALSDVFPGSGAKWSKPTGGFIQFKGITESSSRAGTRLAAVKGRTSPGSRRLQVSTTSVLTAGQRVRVFAPVRGLPERQLSARVYSVNGTAGWMELDRPLPFATQPGCSVHRYAPSVREGGVERLTIEFSKVPRYGPHASDRGYNAIYLRSAANMWINQVTVLDADSALVLDQVDHATLRDVTVGASVRRWAAADATWRREGHHAIALAGCHAVLVNRFRITSRYYHDLAATDSSLLNVFTGGSALDLNLHHARGPLANLFSDLEVGAGRRLFVSPGGTKPGPLTTYWNLRVPSPPAAPPSPPPPSPPSPPPPESGCGTPEQDVDLWDADLKTVKATTQAECFCACAATASCGAFTLVAAWGECYLKTASGWTRQTLKGAQSVVVVPCKQASTAGRTTKKAHRHSGRRLAAAQATSPRSLPLPACAYGSDLNFIGSWGPASRKCPGNLVAPLNSSLPLDFYWQQWFDRGDLPPIPAGAHRPVAEAATEACRTWMDGPEDPLECWDLAYDHCIPGYTSRNWVPKAVVYNEQRVLAELFKQTASEGDFGQPPVPPSQYSRICVASARAGTGACRKVKPGSYRIHVLGFRPPGLARCDHVTGKTSFVKAHLTPQHQVYVYGRVGHR
ncbi:hypothetical protein ABPG75_013028 [Micractinium tetrahymenae]